MSILSTHLKKYKNKYIIVVMTDKMSYFGKLHDHDDHFLMLEDVKEADQKNPIWKVPRIKIPKFRQRSPSKSEKGELKDFVDDGITGRTLGTVLINISHVSRIWGEDFISEKRNLETW